MRRHEIIELLTNLDFVILKVREICGWPDKSEILKNLRPRLKRVYSEQQIDNKIRSLINSTDPKVIEDVYKHGSIRMSDLDDDIKLKVLERLEHLKNEDICRVVATPRQLRSAPQNSIVGLLDPIKRNTRSSERRSVRSVSRGIKSETVGFKQETTKFYDRTPTRSIRKTPRTEVKSGSSEIVKEETLSRTTLLNGNMNTISGHLHLPRSTPPKSSIPDTEESTISSLSSPDSCMLQILEDAHSSPKTSQSFFYTTQLNDETMVDYEDSNALQHYPDNTVLDYNYETLRDLFNDNVYFRQRLSDSEQKRKNVDQRERLRHSLLPTGSTDHLQTMTDRIEVQNEQINSLQNQLNNQRFLQPFLALGEGEAAPLNQAQIRTFHAKMTKDLANLPLMDCFQSASEAGKPVESMDLAALKSGILSDWSEYPIGLAMQSLTGAAICEWVFHGKMQCTAMLNTPLLEGYRNHLRTICGDLALRNVDLAAHQWIIDQEPHFQEEFIPRVARKLSERFLNALSPFMQEKKASEVKLQIRLESIFCSALKIKSLAMIDKNVYECIWPTNDSPFDEDCMVEHSEGGKSDTNPMKNHVGKTVMLPLVPGLRVFNYDRKLVDYCGFVKDDVQGLGQASLLAQAVVVA